MNILFAASELSPIAKTGGLGDVMAALPAALRRDGHSVCMTLPLYRQVREKVKDLAPTDIRLPIHLDQQTILARVWQGTGPGGVRLFAIEHDPFFDRPALYGEAGDYEDNAARFIFFSRAVVELAAYITPLPQLFHLNDWQTALIPALIKSAGLPYRTVFTIHNLAYQGIFSATSFPLTGLPGAYFSPAAFEHFGQFNLMKGALLLADQVSTVSPGYAEEIKTSEFGCGFDGLLRNRSDCLTGIINGIDTNVWNPAEDPFLPVTYDSESLHLKDRCKQTLQRECGWNTETAAPLFGCVSRLVGQKGLDVVAAATPELVRRGGRLVLLGAGDPALESAFTGLAREFPNQVAVQIGFDEGLAHRIEAGSDFFLMPSRFEPCGLNQMYSQRYGTVPIVHAVGGLRDTVKPWKVAESGFLRGLGTGFVFDQLGTDSLLRSIDAAMRVRRFRPHWQQIRQNGMATDFSWESIIPQYLALYQKACS